MAAMFVTYALGYVVSKAEERRKASDVASLLAVHPSWEKHLNTDPDTNFPCLPHGWMWKVSSGGLGMVRVEILAPHKLLGTRRVLSDTFLAPHILLGTRRGLSDSFLQDVRQDLQERVRAYAHFLLKEYFENKAHTASIRSVLGVYRTSLPHTEDLLLEYIDNLPKAR